LAIRQIVVSSAKGQPKNDSVGHEQHVRLVIAAQPLKEKRRTESHPQMNLRLIDQSDTSNDAMRRANP
jgi:hypothetical protein